MTEAVESSALADDTPGRRVRQRSAWRLLLEHVLHYAKARGVTRVVGHVLRENDKMLDLAKRLGFVRESGRSGEADIRVVKPTASL